MASIHKRNKGWTVRWRQGKNNRSRTFKTKDEARRWQGMVERSEIAAPHPSQVPTLIEYADRWLDRRPDLAETTRTQYRRWLDFHIHPELGHRPVSELTPQVMLGWQDQRLADGAGPAVLGKAQTLLSQILDRAVLEGFLPHNPLASLKRPAHKKNEPRFLSASQVEAIRDYYLDHDDLGSATLVSVLAYVGIRPQDALALEWRDDTGRLTVSKKNVDGKIMAGTKTGDGYNRTVYVPAQVRADLMDWREAAPNSTLIFPNRKGEPWSKANYNNWRSRRQFKDGKPAKIKCFKRAAIEAGLGESLKPYDLRHTAATLYAAAGWNHLEIARQLGHSPEISMRVYQHLLDYSEDRDKRPIEDAIAEARQIPVPRLFPETEKRGSSH
jgi:integrase